MDYKSLSRENFDAIVTGEFTHYALWLENALMEIIVSYFMSRSNKRKDFERLFLRRDGLTFQDKIEIVRAMLPLFKNQSAASALKAILIKIEEFKAFRNAFAHGFDSTRDGEDKLSIRIEVVTRAGKVKTVDVNPDSHAKLLADADQLLLSIQKTGKAVNRVPASSKALNIKSKG